MRTKNDEPTMTLQKRELLLDMGEIDETSLQSMSENGSRIVFQLHSDSPLIYRSVSLNGQTPHIHQILDALAESIGRNLKFVYDYEGHRFRITFADYVK